jgi:hypothetical protein
VKETMDCKEFEKNLQLYIYEELRSDDRTSFDRHLQSCPACQQEAAAARAFHLLMNQRIGVEPGAETLARLRAALDESLDREEQGWQSLVRSIGRGWTDLPAWIHPSRAVAVLTLVLFGFGLGWMLRPRLRPAARRIQSVVGPAVAYAGADLGHINAISQVDPNPKTGQVKITLNAERRVRLEGSLDDPRIRQVLVYAVKSYDNPGIRLDTLNALKNGSHNPAVQDALLYALLHDPNAGVRLEALKTVQQMGWNAEVREALLQAVRRDSNPGVRVSAINELANHAVKDHDRQLMPVLKGLASGDSNIYVRLKALAAVEQLEQSQ